MKSLLTLACFLLMTNITLAQNEFLTKQLQFERVKTAYDEKWAGLREELNRKNYGNNYSVLLIAYKQEGELQFWIKNKEEISYRLFKTYGFCAKSGTLGPKLKEGDLQTPEGIYKINVFNPESSYHLSMGIDYPNAVDLARTGEVLKPGGDIYIHGNCVTVGCIPLTDEKIKEAYLLSIFATSGGQKDIPVYIFPFKMSGSNMRKFNQKFPQHAMFWDSLRSVYEHFRKEKTLSNIKQVNGTYLVK